MNAGGVERRIQRANRFRLAHLGLCGGPGVGGWSTISRVRGRHAGLLNIYRVDRDGAGNRNRIIESLPRRRYGAVDIVQP